MQFRGQQLFFFCHLLAYDAVKSKNDRKFNSYSNFTIGIIIICCGCKKLCRKFQQYTKISIIFYIFQYVAKEGLKFDLHIIA